MAITKDEALKAALEWAHSYGYKGDTLPKGKRGDGDACPLGVATGMFVCGNSATDFGITGFLDVPVPPAVERFVDLFDEGAYPDLIADEVA